MILGQPRGKSRTIGFRAHSQQAEVNVSGGLSGNPKTIYEIATLVPHSDLWDSVLMNVCIWSSLEQIIPGLICIRRQESRSRLYSGITPLRAWDDVAGGLPVAYVTGINLGFVSKGVSSPRTSPCVHCVPDVACTRRLTGFMLTRGE